MSRWRKALIAATVGLAASASFVAMPAEADTFNLVVDYSCTGGIAGNATINLKARVQIPTTVQQGGMLKLGWSIEHVGTPRFKSPDYFAEGARVSLIGNVKLDGAWNGTLEAHGSEDQGALKPNLPLTPPEGLSSEAHMTQSGVIKLTPLAMSVDFVPPAGEVVVNNDEAPDDLPQQLGLDGHTNVEYGDWLRDVHVTNTRTDEASIKFRGTGFEYIGREMPGAGRVRVIIDDDDSAGGGPDQGLQRQPHRHDQGQRLPLGAHGPPVRGAHRSGQKHRRRQAHLPRRVQAAHARADRPADRAPIQLHDHQQPGHGRDHRGRGDRADGRSHGRPDR